MRKIAVCLVLILVFSLSSCFYSDDVSDVSQLESVVSEIESVIEQEVDALEKYSKPLLPLVKPVEIEVDFPEKIPEYIPEVNVFPLTNPHLVYGGRLIAKPVNFIDKNYNLINIPKQAIGYYEITSRKYNKNNESVEILQCYSLYDDNDKYAIMNVDGEMLTDFIYDLPFFHNSYYSYAANGYVTVNKEFSDKKEVFGILDIRTGKEIDFHFPGNVVMFDNYILVTIPGKGKKKDEYKLVDYNGNELYDFENEPVHYASSYASPYMWEYFTGDEKYKLNAINNTLLYKENKNLDFFEYDEYYLISDNDKISVYNKKGEHIFSDDTDLFHYDESGNFYIINRSENTINVITDGTVKTFTHELKYHILWYGQHQYKDDTLSFIATIEDKYVEETTRDIAFSIDINGNVLSQKLQRNIRTTTIDTLYTHNDIEYFIRSYNLDKRYFEALLDKNKKVLISKDKYSVLHNIDSFIIAIKLQEEEKKEAICDIYNIEGKLLLEDVLGYTVVIPNAGLIVYKNHSVCGILDYNGNYKQINAPKVEHFNAGHG